MQAFCETCAPHFFYILISTIVSTDGHATSERHSHLQRQKIVALLKMLPYFRYLLQITMYLPKVLKNCYILYDLQNFHVNFILTVSAVTGTKQPLYLNMITGIMCNFP